MVLTLCREICHHKEAYVRRAVLFAASCILVALHPSYVASSLADGNLEVSEGLEWVRTWALHVAESDTDRECYTVSKKCKRFLVGSSSGPTDIIISTTPLPLPYFSNFVYCELV